MKFPLFTELGGETWRILRFPDENDKRWSAFNPCIAYSPVEGYTILFRSSNYFFDPSTGDAIATIGTKVRSRMWLANLTKDWQIAEGTLREIDFSNSGVNFLRGAEDGRLFWRAGSWEFTASMKEPAIPFPRIGKFRLDGLKARLVELYDTPDLQKLEKNWMAPQNEDAEFDYVYGPTSVYEVGTGVVEKRKMVDAIKDVRGGAPLCDLGEWGYLTVIHEADTKEVEIYSARSFGTRKTIVRKYYHRFARYDRSGTLIGLSDRFKFDGVRIEFAAGLVVDGTDVIISYGYKDVVAKLAKIKLAKVKKMIKEV
jgi:predicted GH43/DUF377 family glycosyl hydrolase